MIKQNVIVTFAKGEPFIMQFESESPISEKAVKDFLIEFEDFNTDVDKIRFVNPIDETVKL